MSANQLTIERYLDGFRNTNRPQVLSCVTDDVEWTVPGIFQIHGKAEFEQHIVDEGFAGHPEITVSRLLESGDVVVVEGTVKAPRVDRSVLNLAFCDVFEMRKEKIARLISYLVVTK